jgi:hypothetical protein
MKIISHRGNLDGRIPDCENTPTYIDKAIKEGFDVEIDVWFVCGDFFLGHDAAIYHIDSNWITIRATSLWCHAKNIEAIEQLLLMDNINYFWHETDKMTLTSIGIPWMYPNNYSHQAITVELSKPKNIPTVWGICTDYPVLWKKYENIQTK